MSVAGRGGGATPVTPARAMTLVMAFGAAPTHQAGRAARG